MLDQGEIEGLATSLYREVGHSAAEPVAPFRLAVGLLGPHAVRRFRDPVLRADAYLARVAGEWRVYLREGLPPAVARFDLAHELAEWALRRAGHRDSPTMDVEASSDALAAALLAPRPFAQSAINSRGPQWRQLALDFGSSESCAALRYGEVTGRPVVLVTPTSVRDRGGLYPWPSDEELRSSRRLPGIVKTKIRDASSRIVARAG